MRIVNINYFYKSKNTLNRDCTNNGFLFYLYFRTLHDKKILGLPVKIDDKKYARNAFYFNLCFVCDAWARTVHYEPLLKKLSDYLIGMELESKFLSLQDEDENEKKKIIENVESSY